MHPKPSCEGVNDLPADHVVLVVGWTEARVPSVEVEEQVTLVRRQVHLGHDMPCLSTWGYDKCDPNTNKKCEIY